MIKLIYCMRRLHYLSFEEFQSHWLEYNIQFPHRHRFIQRNIRYQTLANDPTREVMVQARIGTIEPFDGVAVVWWNNLDDMRAYYKNAAFAEALADMKLFIDISRSVAFLTQEQVIIEPEGSVPYVLIACLRRRPDLDRAAFQRAWLDHAEISRRAYAQGLLKGYIQNHTLSDNARVDLIGRADEPWDGVDMIYFDSIAKFKALVASPLAGQETLEDQKKFIDHGRSMYMLTRRHVTKDIVR